MKRIKRGLLASLLTAGVLTLTLGGVAEAQKKGKEAERVKTYDFTGDDIDGDLVKPDGEFLDTRKFATHTSLIKIRKDFIREIVKSAENL